MVLPGFFSKSSPKKNQDRAPTENRRPSAGLASGQSSRSPSKSPIKSPRVSENKSSKKNPRSRPGNHRLDPGDTHPLNLPPEERDRRRSAMSSANEDMDTAMPDYSDGTADMDGETPQENGHMTGSAEYAHPDGSSSPAESPHKSPSPPPKPAIDAEECKSLGNKYFKAKDYTKAVAEYTKGMAMIRPICYGIHLTYPQL